MQSLGVSAAVQDNLTTEMAGRLASLGEWDISKVSSRTRRRLKWSRAHGRAVEQEYRRFLGLLILNPEKEYGMAGDVDELWHDHILDTQNYLTMCRQVVGAVVHHCPGDGQRPATGESAYDTGTYPDLARTYAGPVSRIWPKQGEDAAVARCCGHSLERFAD